MKNRIIGYIHSRLIITMHHHWLADDAHLRKKRLNPHQFRSYICH